MQGKSMMRAAVAAATLSALAAASVVGASTASATPTRKTVPNSAPTWTAHAQKLGKTSATASVSARVYLAPKGGLDALKSAAVAASTPGSASYRKFLTTDQYNAAYQPTAATVSSVKKWLTANGLRVTSVSEGNSFISVTGNVAAAQKAFAVSVDTYNHDGEQVQAPSTDVSTPAEVASSVIAVTGLDTSTKVMTHHDDPPASFQNARPCSQVYGQLPAKYAADYKTPLPKFQGKVLPYAVCGYTGPQFRSAYENNSSLTGKGVTVAIVDAYAAPTIVSDINTYAANHGDGTFTKNQYTQVTAKTETNQADCGPSGWYGEQTLDIEAVHAMAPDAKIRYYGAASCFDTDFVDALQKVVNQNKVELVSNSWGDTETNESPDQVAAYEKVFLQGAMEGISFMFSSGDNGDEVANAGLKTADYPTSDPYVTAVGGTSTAIDSTETIAFQAGWGTQKYSLAANGKSWTPVGYLYGAGGGYSSLFERPSYQKGVVPANAPAGRAVPDVAMDADPNTGMLIGETQTFPDGTQQYGEYRIGGTSLASPLFAGMTALTLQAGGGKGIGLLNPTIYAQAKKTTFTDVQGAPKDLGTVRVDFANGNDSADGLLYSVRTFGQDSSLTVTKGWDNVTGIGTPNVGWLTAVAPL